MSAGWARRARDTGTGRGDDRRGPERRRPVGKAHAVPHRGVLPPLSGVHRDACRPVRDLWRAAVVMWRWVADRVVPRRAVSWHTPKRKFRLRSFR